MKTSHNLIFVFCAVTIFSFGYAMEADKNAAIQITPKEQDHWSTKEIQNPLKLKQKKYSLFSPLEPSPYSFINATSMDIDLSFYYQIESSNDPNLNFDKVNLTDFFGGSYDYQDGKLIDTIEIKENIGNYYTTKYEDWYRIEKSIEKILMNKKNYNRFKFTLKLECSCKHISNWINFSCLSFPILSLTTDKLPLEYHYINHFNSIFVITQKLRQYDDLGSELTFHIENRKTMDYLLSKDYPKNFRSVTPLFS